jgi:hypothetical protein
MRVERHFGARQKNLKQPTNVCLFKIEHSRKMFYGRGRLRMENDDGGYPFRPQPGRTAPANFHIPVIVNGQDSRRRNFCAKQMCAMNVAKTNDRRSVLLLRLRR